MHLVDNKTCLLSPKPILCLFVNTLPLLSISFPLTHHNQMSIQNLQKHGKHAYKPLHLYSFLPQIPSPRTSMCTKTTVCSRTGSFTSGKCPL